MVKLIIIYNIIRAYLQIIRIKVQKEIKKILLFPNGAFFNYIFLTIFYLIRLNENSTFFPIFCHFFLQVRIFKLLSISKFLPPPLPNYRRRLWTSPNQILRRPQLSHFGFIALSQSSQHAVRISREYRGYLSDLLFVVL